MTAKQVLQEQLEQQLLLLLVKKELELVKTKQSMQQMVLEMEMQ